MCRKKCWIGRMLVTGALVLSIASAFGERAVWAKESSENTVIVENFEELKAAFLDSNISEIYVANDILIPCGNNDFDSEYKSKSAALVADRDLVIEGYHGKSYTLTRYVENKEDDMANCRSMIEVYGDGIYDNVQVSIQNLVLDGGAIWNTDSITARDNSSTSGRWATNTGYAGRAIIDVANKGTVNLESGCVLKNAQTSVNSQTRQKVGNVSGSACYGAGIRIEYSDIFGGGTANLKMGAVIEDCSSVNWGGAIGAYNYGRLNIYGGTIRRCSSGTGAAICCTYRSGTDSSTASVMKMYGGVIENCVSPGNGVINIDGSNELASEFTGGIIRDCSGYAINVSEIQTKLNVADYDGENIQISNVTSGNFTSENYTEKCGIRYTSIDNISFIDSFILLFVDGNQTLGNISIEKNTAAGASFPANPVKEGYQFNHWISDEGNQVDATTVIAKNYVLHANWTNLHEHGEIEYAVLNNVLTATCHGTIYPKNCENEKVSLSFEQVEDDFYVAGKGVGATLIYEPGEGAWKELTGIQTKTVVKYEALNQDKQWIDLGKDAPTKEGTYRAYTVVGDYIIYSNEYHIFIKCQVCTEGNGSIVYVENQPATCVDVGVKAHYFCEVCGTSYEDRECTVILSEEDMVIPAKGHTYETIVEKATISTDGKIEEKCACGDVANAEVISHPVKYKYEKSAVYTGKAIKPAVTVIDAAGNTVSTDDYIVTYSKNKSVGSAKIKIEFTGYYSGITDRAFRILPPATEIVSVENSSKCVAVKWKKVSAASGYLIYRSINGGSFKKISTIGKNTTVQFSDTGAKTNGTKYQYKIVAYKEIDGKTYASAYSKVKAYYFLTSTKISSLQNNQAGSITVKWNQNAKADGYQIKVVTDNTEKIYTVSKVSTLNKKISKLKKGKTYEVSVRSYKKDGKSKDTSAWSACKRIKITK